MTTLNEADQLYLAGLPVDRVYLDGVIVWPPRQAYGEQLYGRGRYGTPTVVRKEDRDE